VKTIDRFELEHLGYFCVDLASKQGNLIFKSIVTHKEAAEKTKTTAKNDCSLISFMS
jgi:hypothetical protein